MPNLEQLLNPTSVAVIGASRDERKLGSIVVRNILDSGYRGTIYPINPKAEKVFELNCYPNLRVLPETPDLAIISLPAKLVLQTMEEISESGIGNVLIFSAGFKEIGAEGKDLEKELKDFADRKNINVLGPNCLGFANTSTPINATFGKVPKNKGNLRFISQSGAVAAGIFDWAEYADLGFSEFITLGNKTVLDETHILEYWKKMHLEDFAPIGMYLESIVQGKKFLKVTKELSKKHPIFVLKPGKSQAAQKAMQSHTGAIAGEDYVLETAFNQAGIIRCHDIQDMFDLSLVFSWSHIPQGPNIAVVSNAGGPAVISADIVTEFDLNLAKLSDETIKVLSDHLPRAASLLNPVDVLGDALADRYRYALKAVLAEESVDSVLVILTPQIMTQIEETAEVISTLAREFEKPIVCAFIGGSQISFGERILNKNHVPSFRFPERAIEAISRMYKWQRWVNENKDEKLATEAMPLGNPVLATVQETINNALESGQKTLDINTTAELMKSVGFKVPDSKDTSGLEEALNFADKATYPVVLKVSSTEILHKKDVGGVITNIDSKAALETAYKEMSERIGDTAITVQKQIDGGVEVIVGVKKDPNFGNVLMFGAGGTFAELIADRNLHLLPISNKEIQSLVENSKIYKLLEGYRGSKQLALEKLYELISLVALLAESVDVITDFEINPVIVTENNAWAVDGKILL